MSQPVSLLMIEFLTWVASGPRTYADAMEAWRSSCPRHTVWEDALVEGLIHIESSVPVRQAAVSVTARGQALLDADCLRVQS